MGNSGYRLVLLDRDGVINQKAEEHDYIRTADMAKLLPGVGTAIAKLNQAGLKVAVVTNQRGVSRGLMTLSDVEAVNKAIEVDLALDNARIDSFHVCPHGYEDNCKCRKPEPGLLLEAIAKYGVEKAECIMVGDSSSDAYAAKNAGVDCIYIHQTNDLEDLQNVSLAPDLPRAVDIILKRK